MSKKLMFVVVRGKRSQWMFEFYGDPQYLDEWRADGLDVNIIENTIPNWLPIGWERAWCIAQDLFNFRNPFRT